jgi:putative PIN family toxin of toxin-antitoxin system
LALVYGGQPRQVTDMIAHREARVVMSEEIMTEIRRIILVKFPDFQQEVRRLEKLLRHYALWVKLGTVNIDASCYPDDNKILETAVVGKARFVVSGDKDLLVLNKVGDIRIVAPADFLSRR